MATRRQVLVVLTVKITWNTQSTWHVEVTPNPVAGGTDWGTSAHRHRAINLKPQRTTKVVRMAGGSRQANFILSGTWNLKTQTCVWSFQVPTLNSQTPVWKKILGVAVFVHLLNLGRFFIRFKHLLSDFPTLDRVPSRHGGLPCRWQCRLFSVVSAITLTDIRRDVQKQERHLLCIWNHLFDVDCSTCWFRDVGVQPMMCCKRPLREFFTFVICWHVQNLRTKRLLHWTQL